MARSKNETKVSPRGVFVFPHLIEPDFELKDCGEYSVKLRVSAADGAGLKNEIDAAAEAKNKAESTAAGKQLKAKELPYTVDEESGDLIFAFRKNATFKDAKTGEVRESSISIKTNTKVDGRFEDHPKDVSIWSGTVGRVAFQLYPYLFSGKTGVRLNLVSAKILKLVTGGGRDAFGDEDDDYDDIDEAHDFAKDDEEACGADKGSDDSYVGSTADF